MLSSASWSLDRMAPFLPAALVGPPQLAWARAAVADLPVFISNACLEHRLGPGADRVDFIACVTARDGGREVLAALPADSPLRRRPGWAPVFDLVAEWARPGSALGATAPFVCLAIDAAGPAEASAPRALVCLQPGLTAGPLPPRDAGGAAELDAVLDAAFLALSALGERPSPAVERRVRACARALPASGHVLHAGSLRTRGEDAVRFVCSMRRGEVPAYLERIGWPGDAAEVREMLSTLSLYSNTLTFDLDVGEEVAPVLGLGHHEPRPGAATARVLDRLCAAGACTPEKAAALLGWPGREEVVVPGHAWPSVAERVFEMKIVWQPGQPLSAKGYLGLGAHFSLFGG